MKRPFSVVKITSRADASPASTVYLFAPAANFQYVDSNTAAYHRLVQEPQVGGALPTGGRSEDGATAMPMGFVGGVATGAKASEIVLDNPLPDTRESNARPVTFLLGAGLEGQDVTLYRIALEEGEAPPALSSGDWAKSYMRVLTVQQSDRDSIAIRVAPAASILEEPLTMELYRGFTDAALKLDATMSIGWTDVSSGGTNGWLYNIITASEWVIEFQVYAIDLATNTQDWLLWGDGVADGIRVRANGSGNGLVKLTCIGLTDTSVQTPNDILAADRFVSVAVWRTASEIGIHINGELSNSNASTGTITVPAGTPSLDVGNTSSAVTICGLRYWTAKPTDAEIRSRQQRAENDWPGLAEWYESGAAAIWTAGSGTAAQNTDQATAVATADWVYGGEGDKANRGKTHPVALGTVNWAKHYEVNAGVRIADLGQAELSNVILTQQGVIPYSPIDGQDETDYAAFAGGTGYANADKITLPEGTVATVDNQTAGMVDQYTVDSTSTTASSRIGDTLAQSSVAPAGGTGFTLTVETANLEPTVVYATPNSPHSGLVTIDNSSGTLEDEWRYQFTAISIADRAAILDYLAFDSPGIGPVDSADKSSDFGAWLDETGVGLFLPPMDKPPQALEELEPACAGAGVVLAKDSAGEWTLLRVPFTPWDLATEADATIEAGLQAPFDGIEVDGNALEHPAKRATAAFSPTEDVLDAAKIDFDTLGRPPTGDDLARVQQLQNEFAIENWDLDPADVAGDMLDVPLIRSRVQTAPQGEQIARLALPGFSERGARYFTANLRDIAQSYQELGARIVLKDPDGHDTPAGGIPCRLVEFGGAGIRYDRRPPEIMGDAVLLEQRWARVSPTSLVSSSGFTAPTVAQVQDDPLFPSADFMLATGGVSATARLAFDRTTSEISIDTATDCEFRIRIEGTVASCALTVWLEEDSVNIAALRPSTLIGNGYTLDPVTTSVEIDPGAVVAISYPWDPTVLTVFEDAEIYFSLLVTGGATAKVYSVDYRYRVSQRSS